MSNVNHIKRGANIKLKGLVFAKLLTDLAIGVTYAADLHLVPGIIEAGMTASISEEVLGADDNPTYDLWNSLDSVDVNMTVAALGTDVEGFLMGRQKDGNGVTLTNSGDEGPWVAMGFMSERSDKSIDYIWLLKGKFKPGDKTYRTRERGTVNFQTPSIVGTFGPRDYDGNIKADVNSKDEGVPASVFSNFFTQVYEPVSTITITQQPEDANYSAGMKISVAATASNGGTLTYQWYSNTTESTTGGMEVADATTAELTVPTLTATTYYYCVVGVNGTMVTKATDPCTITVA